MNESDNVNHPPGDSATFLKRAEAGLRTAEQILANLEGLSAEATLRKLQQLSLDQTASKTQGDEIVQTAQGPDALTASKLEAATSTASAVVAVAVETAEAAAAAAVAVALKTAAAAATAAEAVAVAVKNSAAAAAAAAAVAVVSPAVAKSTAADAAKAVATAASAAAAETAAVASKAAAMVASAAVAAAAAVAVAAEAVAVAAAVAVSKAAAHAATVQISAQALAFISQGVLIADGNRLIVSANASFQRITGYTEPEVLGKTCAFMQGPLTNPQLVASIHAHSLAGTEFQGEILNYRKDGNTFWNELTITCVRNAQGQATHYIGITRDITDRKEIERALQVSIKDKVALLNEVHHRVKNNLQVITSLMRLESGRSGQPETRDVLGNMQNRIRAMELLHRMLYQSGTFASVDLAKYIEQIATQAFGFQAAYSRSIRLKLSLSSVSVNLDQAAPFGLLVAELISNCLKHGFPNERAGEVTIDLHPVPNASTWSLCVKDNGVGLPNDFEAQRDASLGLQLVNDLSKQLGGSLTVGTFPAQGTTFTVIFSPESLGTPSAQAIRPVSP